MTFESREYVISTTLTGEEKKKLDFMAHDWGIRSGTIMRRLIQYFIADKMSLVDVLKKSNEIKDNLPNSAEEKTIKYFVRTSLGFGEKNKLNILVSEWDLSNSAVTRRLIQLFIAGVIEKKDIW